MAEAKVLVGTEQTLTTYPRVSTGGAWVRGQPADDPQLGVRIGTPAVSMPAAYDDDVTRDTTSVLTTAAASEGATQLTVASATWVRGRRYLIELADGTVLDVTCRKSATGTTLYLAEPLVAAVASGAAVKGWALLFALSEEQTDQPGNAQALWRATVDGVVHVWPQTFRICRRIPVSTLTPTKLTTSWSVVKELRNRADVDLEETILAAWEHRILPLLAARGVNEEDVLAVEVLEPLHALACVLQLATGRASVPTEVFDRFELRWNQLVETTFASNDWHEEPQTDETPALRPDTPPVVKTGIRLVR